MFSWRFIGDVVAPALCVIWTAFLFFGAVFGSNGYLALQSLEAERAAKSETVAQLERRRDALESAARRLNPRSLDPDTVDEKVRGVLGYTRPGDLVLPADELQAIVDTARATN